MLLVIINPVSGSGKSVKIYNNIKIFIGNHEMYITDYQGHVTELISSYTLENINKIILIGGDGLIHEVIHGLIYNEIYNIPICIIPTGSGNGLAKSLNINNIDDAIKCIYSNNTKKIDLYKVLYKIPHTILYKRTEYSFLAQTWTMISDIDIGTEGLRWMGDIRYFFGILKFLLFNKSVQGELNYQTKDKGWNLVEGKFTLFCASNVPWLSSDFKMLPNADMNDKLIDIIYIVNYTMTFFERIKLLYYVLKGQHIEKCHFINYIQASQYTLQETAHNKNTSYMVCDGELINTKRIQVENTDLEMLFSVN